ncbi:VOC family protein [Aquabacter sp. CN5-332]|uniref:VOC family protein n=1 Tax=Aquabacter sp. CN5-332 TaxID=3156608 RepID=UPI0032B60BAC
MIRINRLAFAAFASPDTEQLADYYAQVIGLSETSRARGTIHLASPLGETCVLLSHGDATACQALAFETSAETPLCDLAKWLDGHGIASELRSDPHPDIAAVLAFRDYNGTGIELFNAAPPPALVPPTPAISPLKLGHAAFYVNEIHEAVNFYRNILGFRIADWMEDFFVFLRCGPDHHTCNFIAAPRQGMHHMAFELRDWAHLQTACDWLSRSGYKLTWGPGRHGIGHNIFTYHRNPQGQIVELFTELDTMSNEELGYYDPRPWHRDRPQRPKVWSAKDAVNLWGDGPPPGHRD